MITSILGFFALGTFGFWLLLTIASVIFIAAIENDKYTLPSVIAIGLGVAYWKAIAILDWKAIAVGIVIYASVGVLWSMFRWFRYVKKTAEDFRSKHGKNLEDHGQLSNFQYCISVAQNKSRITAWIAFWPWSFVWNITGDFFTMLYENLRGIYQKIANNAAGDLLTIKSDKK